MTLSIASGSRGHPVGPVKDAHQDSSWCTLSLRTGLATHMPHAPQAQSPLAAAGSAPSCSFRAFTHRSWDGTGHHGLIPITPYLCSVNILSASRASDSPQAGAWSSEETSSCCDAKPQRLTSGQGWVQAAVHFSQIKAHFLASPPNP